MAALTQHSASISPAHIQASLPSVLISTNLCRGDCAILSEGWN
ncbi:hypothetical protein E2C01_100302 [Portunus trituberculatus]|uniref:Uncharacterized protein n=1 Tax=Portunus trituberculatus TaxID=210409 RepID=A0A5B7KCP5_PORTR|nr:hypothetical protein [Portunus trituberculatus]